jgi:hypothetical protein
MTQNPNFHSRLKELDMTLSNRKSSALFVANELATVIHHVRLRVDGYVW